MKNVFSILTVLLLSFTMSLNAQSTYDKEQGNIDMPSYQTDKSGGTYSPMGLRGEHYSFWIRYDDDDVPKANIYVNTDESYAAVELNSSWYRYDTFENAVKAWYIKKKWGVIMKKGTNQR